MSREAMFLLVALGGLTCLGLLVITIVQGRRAITASKRLAWLESQLNRALSQINSNDEAEILAGCQTLTVLNDRQSRMRALKRLTDLMRHENPRVARQARITYENIIASLASAGSAPHERCSAEGSASRFK